MPGLPGTKFVLDGERHIEVLRPISAEGEKLKIKSTVCPFYFIFFFPSSYYVGLRIV